MSKPLPPFPDGWYAVAVASDLGRGALVARRLFGRDVVLYRTGAGAPAAMDATCPHLGANMGHGGTVHGDVVRCPFHGFEYATDGRCVATPYGKRVPGRARVRAYPVRERNGLLLVWSGAGAPTWEVPELDVDGWTPVVGRSFALRGHPQETSENSVDVGHFGVVHKFTDVEVAAPLHTDGPYLRASYRFAHPSDLLVGVAGAKIPIRFTAHLWGLGYSLVDVEVPSLRVRTRNWVLSTPTDPERIELLLAVSVRRPRVPGPGGDVASRAVARLLRAFVLRGFVTDTAQDFEIWAHKRYESVPALAEGDGPIGRYRAWSRQFYPADDARSAA